MQPNHSIIVGLEGTVLTDAERVLLKKPYVMGVLLLAPNITDEAQVKKLTTAIKTLRPEKNFLITADFEAKAVWRAKDADGNPSNYLPQPMESMRSLGKIYEAAESDEARQNLLSEWQNYAFELGTALLNLGINVNFAPLLDSHHENSTIIGGIERAFSSDPEVIINCARAFLKGFKKAGLHTNSKHYPDHGFAQQDSHLEATTDHRTAEELKAHLEIYRVLINENLVDSIMTAHIIYPHIDPDHVASRSKVWHDILRKELAYQGAVYSDCMTMKGSGEDQLSDKLYDAFASGTNAVILGGLPKGHAKHSIYPLFSVEVMISATEAALERIEKQQANPSIGRISL